MFFDRDGHLHCQTMPKNIMGYRLVPECNLAQESRTCQFLSLFFLPYLQSHGLLRSRNFASMAT